MSTEGLFSRENRWSAGDDTDVDCKTDVAGGHVYNKAVLVFCVHAVTTCSPQGRDEVSEEGSRREGGRMKEG